MYSYLALSLGIILAQLEPLVSIIAFIGLGVCLSLFLWIRFRLKPQDLRFKRIILYAVLFAFGFSYASLRINYRYQSQLSAPVKNIQISGYLTSPVTANITNQQTTFKVTSGKFSGNTFLLNYPLKVKLEPGYIYQLDANLKPTEISHNIDAFDYQEYLIGHNINGFASTYSDQVKLGITYSIPAQINLFRSNLITYLKNVLDNKPYSGLLIALVTGYQKLITAKEWQIYQRSGIVHIVSISGLHITLVTALAILLAQILMRYLPTSRIPRQIILAWIGIIVALTYSLITGFSIPTQRAFYLLVVACYLLTTRQKIPLLQKLAICLIIILLIDPFASLSSGFWFSFAIVATIFLVNSVENKTNSKLQSWLKFQLGVTLISIPVSLYLFNSYAWISFFSNLWAIPLLGNVITPLILASSVLHIGWLIKFTAILTGYIMIPINYLSQAQTYSPAKPDLATLLLTIMGTIIIIIPFRIRGKNIFGAVLFAAIFMVNSEKHILYRQSQIVNFANPKSGFTLIKTQKHNLLVVISDDSTEASNQVAYSILPYLKAKHINQFDWVISNQSESGLISVLEERSINVLSTKLPNYLTIDGVDFEFTQDKKQIALKLNDQNGSIYVGSGYNIFANQTWNSIIIPMPLTKLDWLYDNPCNNLVINPTLLGSPGIDALFDNLNLPSKHNYNLNKTGSVIINSNSISKASLE